MENTENRSVAKRCVDLLEDVNWVFHFLGFPVTAHYTKERVSTMAEESKYVSLAAMLKDDYEGPTTRYFGPASGQEAKLAMLKFLNGNNLALSDCLGCFAPLAGWVVKTAEFQQDTGDARSGLLIGLITADGAYIQATSATIAQTLDSISDILGQPPYKEPVWVQIVEIVTRKKRKTHQIVVVDIKDIPAKAPIVTKDGQVPYDPKPKK